MIAFSRRLTRAVTWAATVTLWVGAWGIVPAVLSLNAHGADAGTWTDADSRLANQYLQLLQRDPSYGKVLDLLWDLYEKKAQTPLLLDYLKGASQSGPPVAKLLYAHLLRKSGDLSGARTLYESIVEAEPSNQSALKSLAEIADQQKDGQGALSLYARLIALLPPDGDEVLAMRRRKATLAQRLGQNDLAITEWNALLKDFPKNVALRTEVVSSLLEIGAVEEAAEALGELAKSGDPRQRLDALLELNRLYEFSDKVESATATAEEAMRLLHFQSQEYAEVFARHVRMHERNGQLGDLEKSLSEKIDAEKPTEQALYDLAEFYRLTADPPKEEEAVKKLVTARPQESKYQLRLIELEMRNDHYTQAGESLDQLIKTEAKPPLDLIMRRALVDLHTAGREAAAKRLGALLQKDDTDAKERRTILDFSRDHHLDHLVEQLLADPVLTVDSTEGSAAPIELAKFLHERGRTEQAVSVLHDYAEAANGTMERAARLYQSSVLLKDMHRDTEALQAVDEAISLVPGNTDYWSARADLYVATQEIEKAITQLEAIRDSRPTPDQRTEIDQRLFSLIRGHYAVPKEAPVKNTSVLNKGRIQSLAEYRRLAAAASRANLAPGDDPPPMELIDYYAKIKAVAEEKPNTDHRFRAAWWAFKLQDIPECLRQLEKATTEAGRPILEVEKMLLELAEQNERTAMMATHLANLIELDPENADDYRRRRAEVRFDLGYEDESVRELEALAKSPDTSLATLNSLAKIYRRLGSVEKQVDVWRHAFRNADLFEKRAIVKQLSTALIDAGEPEEALKVQIDLSEKESDPVQRRKQLDSQIALAQSHYLLDWMQERYSELVGTHPFDRFYPEAVARVSQALGRDRDAYEAMRKAYYMSGRSDDLLGELSDMSARLGDLKSAIYYRRQLLNKEDGKDLVNWMELVQMLEKDLRVSEADQLRHRLETKFSSDTDFLTELSDYYIKANRLQDAERTLTSLVALRSWDLQARLQLGLVQIERRQDATAFDTMNAILADTEGLEYPADYEKGRLPIIRSRRDRSLEPFVFTVEAYPNLGENVQEEIADALQAPRGEFTLVPKNESDLRLRAIEEAAVLSAKLGRVTEWKKRWQTKDRPLFERLWATRYSGDHDAFSTLLRDYPAPETHVDRFCLTYSHFLADKKERFLTWIGEEDTPGDVPHPKAVYAGMAGLILLKESTDDPLLPSSAVYEKLAGIPLAKSTAFHIFTELRKASQWESAYQLGLRFADDSLKDEGLFQFWLAITAGLAGHSSEREQWLERSLQTAAKGSGGRLASYFQAALTERLSTFSSDTERGEYLNQLAMRMAHAPFGRADHLEQDLLFALAKRDEFRAATVLGELILHEAGAALPSVLPTPSDADHHEAQAWQKLLRLLQRYSERLRSNPQSAGILSKALTDPLLMRRAPAEVSLQYEQFEIERSLLLLRWMSPPERAAQIREIQARLREPDSLMDLAKALEHKGFHKEAITVYREAALKRERDYSPLQGLFDAAFHSLEPKPALDVIAQLNSHEFPAPPGLTNDYLNEQHARFLLMNRDTERLSQLGRQPEVRNGAPPVINRSYLPYQDALVEAYRRTGDNDSLIHLLTDMRLRGTISADQTILGAETLAEMDRHQDAIHWLEPLALDPQETIVQRRSVVLSLAYHEKQGNQNPGAVRALALACLGRQSPALVRRIADSLFQAGAAEDAISILHRLRRSSSDRIQRTETSVAILNMERERGKAWEKLDEDLENFFFDFLYQVEPEKVHTRNEAKGVRPDITPVQPNAYRFVQWILKDPEAESKVAPHLTQTVIPSENRWLADLIIAHLEGHLAETVRGLLSDHGWNSPVGFSILETLPAFGELGVAIAKDQVAETAASGPAFFPNEPKRQIALFHRIDDPMRLAEVHASLVRESVSSFFHESGLEAGIPSLETRKDLPALLATVGETELAKSLFDVYDKSLVSGQRKTESLNGDHLAFLIDQKSYAEAESLIRDLVQRSQPFDWRYVPRLYREWDKLSLMEERLRDLSISRGQQVLLQEWTRALAEGREMREAQNGW